MNCCSERKVIKTHIVIVTRQQISGTRISVATQQITQTAVISVAAGAMTPSKEPKDGTSIDCAIEKVVEFTQKIVNIMEKKPKEKHSMKKLAFLKIARMFLQKSLVDDCPLKKNSTINPAVVSGQVEKSSLHQFPSLCPSKLDFGEGNNIAANNCEASSASSHSFHGNASERSAMYDCIEAEIDELASLLFEEANKFVYEERVKQAQLTKELEELKLATAKQPLSMSFTDFVLESKAGCIFKSLSSLQLNERVLIDGMFLGDFQESIAKAKTEGGVHYLMQTDFFKRIYHAIVEPNLMHFRAFKSALARKKLLEACQLGTFFHDRIPPNPALPIAQKCMLCCTERVCEFSLTLSALDLHEAHADRFCLHRLQILTDYYAFLVRISNEHTQPLLILYRTLVHHLHRMSTAIFQGVVLTTASEDSSYPSIDIVH